MSGSRPEARRPLVCAQVFPEQGRCSLLHSTPHAFATGLELHGGTPPLRFDGGHYLALVRFRTGGWARNNRE
jgi:hypothetical protein